MIEAAMPRTDWIVVLGSLLAEPLQTLAGGAGLAGSRPLSKLERSF